MEKPALICIVDDDRPFRESMRTLVRALGYPVETFPSAADFIASRLLSETACLVVDCDMPEMTGIELNRHLVDAGHRIPTIVITAYPDEADRKRALKDGALCYLSKPIDDDHLETLLRSVVEAGKSAKQR